MAYIAPLNSAILAHNQARQTFDPLAVGMKEFADHARRERRALVGHYDAPDECLQALEEYNNKLAETIGFVCTAAEVQTAAADAEQPQLLVGVGAVARAATLVLQREVGARMDIAEGRFAEHRRSQGKRARTGFFGDAYKGGPVDNLAQQFNTDHLSVRSAITNRSLSPAEIIADTPFTSLEDVALEAVQGIVPVQVDLESAAYKAAVAQ